MIKASSKSGSNHRFSGCLVYSPLLLLPFAFPHLQLFRPPSYSRALSAPANLIHNAIILSFCCLAHFIFILHSFSHFSSSSLLRFICILRSSSLSSLSFPLSEITIMHQTSSSLPYPSAQHTTTKAAGKPLS